MNNNVAYNNVESKVISINELRYRKFSNTYDLSVDEKWTQKKKRDLRREYIKAYMKLLSK
jgi:uncharacterized protein YnzC (UPF0291/DUF896 family)